MKNIFQDLVLFWFWGCNKWPHFLPLRSLFYHRPAGTNSFDSPREHHRPFSLARRTWLKYTGWFNPWTEQKKNICYVILRLCIIYRIRIGQEMRIWSVQTVSYAFWHTFSSVN
jgi:hypothetical protein